MVSGSGAPWDNYEFPVSLHPPTSSLLLQGSYSNIVLDAFQALNPQTLNRPRMSSTRFRSFPSWGSSSLDPRSVQVRLPWLKAYGLGFRGFEGSAFMEGLGFRGLKSLGVFRV